MLTCLACKHLLGEESIVRTLFTEPQRISGQYLLHVLENGASGARLLASRSASHPPLTGMFG